MRNDGLPPLHHPHLRHDWNRPIPPIGFDELCCHVTRCGLLLDFVSNARRDFASQKMDLSVDWPWEPSFHPRPADWQAIGIDLVDFR
jgi:hypothetical protein